MRSLGGGLGAVAGQVLPIVEIASPASGRRCVVYQELVESHDMRNVGRRRGAWERVSGNIVGAFIVADNSGQAIVWPAGASLIIDEPWQSREDSLAPADNYDVREESEKIMRAGEIAYVLGTPHTFDALVAKLKEDCGFMPGELLQALLNRPDLRNLPCFFADGKKFIVANQTYEKLSGSLMPDVFNGQGL
ncbi:MAG: hypothetical protein ACHQ2Z_01275 [Elusimicrobiota bacterium]